MARWLDDTAALPLVSSPDGTETVRVISGGVSKRVLVSGIRTPGTPGAAGADAATYFVDPTGSDSNSGSLASPFATISKAVSVAVAGARIMLRRTSVHRSASPIPVTSLDGLRFGAYAKAGDQLPRAQVRFSTNVAAASWTSAAPTYANLYYTTVASDPNAVWEIGTDGTTITRMYYNAKGPSTPAPAAPDLASANAQAGSYYYDSGTSRLYIYPWGGTISGKSYEIPMAATGLTFTYCAGLELSDIDFGFSRDAPVTVTSSTGRSNNCQFGQCGNKTGTGNGLEIGIYSRWADYGGYFYDAGNDGVGMGTGTALGVFHGARFVGNRGDGLSCDAANVDAILIGCTSTANGKQGVVKISSGTLRFEGGRSYANGDEDVYILLSDGSVTSLDATGLQADRIKVNAGASGTITGRLVQHRGPIEVNGAGSSITIEGLRAIGDGTGTGKMQYGIRCNSGTLNVSDFYAVRFAYGVMLTGGTMKLRAGHLLRNLTNGMYQTGGTFDLLLADPANLYGNASAFSAGVSAGDQAKTVAMAAV